MRAAALSVLLCLVAGTAGAGCAAFRGGETAAQVLHFDWRGARLVEAELHADPRYVAPSLGLHEVPPPVSRHAYALEIATGEPTPGLLTADAAPPAGTIILALRAALDPRYEERIGREQGTLVPPYPPRLGVLPGDAALGAAGADGFRPLDHIGLRDGVAARLDAEGRYAVFLDCGTADCALRFRPAGHPAEVTARFAPADRPRLAAIEALARTFTDCLFEGPA